MSPRALVVDDDQAMVRTLSDVLRLQGWEVQTAHNGAAAVQASAAAAEPFDVVLMDVKMPGMDGVDAFKAMKRARPSIRVVLMTAYTEQERLAEAERQGVVQVMSKPLDIRSLLVVLAEQLESDRPVLVVDHDSDFLRTLSRVLELEGYEVEHAVDVPHAVELIDEARPLAVLLHIPHGVEHAREAIRAVHDREPEVAIIVYSGQPEVPALVTGGIPQGWVHAFLQKPFAIDRLTGVLDDIRHRR
jgi:DNA-binding NtrC family response regulator